MIRPDGRSRSYAVVLTSLTGLVLAGRSVAYAQEIDLQGRVVDQHGVGIPAATVEVVGTAWQTSTLASGQFRFRLPGGAWTVRARRLGFRPDTMQVSVPSDSITLMLQPYPIELKGLTVNGERNALAGTTVTPETVRQVPPLGEADIFRAVVLLPAVSQPNDLKGRIHLGGGSSDETAIELDGHPLQDPFHLLGVLGSFNVAALDRADVIIHHLPADEEGKLSGVISLHSRKSATQDREVVVSLLSTSATVIEPHIVGDLNALVSARITYLDRIIGALGRRATIRGDEPSVLGYRDFVLTTDRPWQSGNAAFVIFNSRDRRPMSGSNGYTWGESLIGATVTQSSSHWLWRGRVSFNHAYAGLGDPPIDTEPFQQSVRLRHDLASGDLTAIHQAIDWQVSMGIGFTGRQVEQSWTDAPSGFFSPHAPRSFFGGQDQFRSSVFTEIVKEFASRVTLDAGVRITRSDNQTRTAPRVFIGRSFGSDTQLGFSLDRRFQFETELEEPEEGSGKQPLFLLVSPRVVDVAAVSFSTRPGSAYDLQIVSFHKKYADRTRLPDIPRLTLDTGHYNTLNFPKFDRIPGRAYGLTIALSRPIGTRSIIQGSYTFQRVTESMDGAYRPTSWDAPHAFTLFGSWPLSSKWTMNAVTQWRSGPATTPVDARVYVIDPSLDNTLQPRYILGSANSLRLPGYRRTDLGVRRESRRGHTQIAFTAQVINLLAHDNGIEYEPADLYCLQSKSCKAKPSRSGLPIIPTIGLEVRW